MWGTHYYILGLMGFRVETVVKYEHKYVFGQVKSRKSSLENGGRVATSKLIKFWIWFQELDRDGTSVCGRLRFSRELVAFPWTIRFTRNALQMEMELWKMYGEWMRDTDRKWLMLGYRKTETEKEWKPNKKNRSLKQQEVSWFMMMHFRLTFLPWKSNKHYIFCVSVCSINYPAWKAHASYCHCGFPSLTIFFHFISLMTRLLEKGYWT